jgi:hypothetical protein
VFTKEYGRPSRFPKSSRIWGVVWLQEFDRLAGSNIWEYTWNFFPDLGNLLAQSYLPNFMYRWDNENCDYADIVMNAKNTYLSITMVTDVQNIAYSRSVKNHCENVIASIMVWKDSSNVFESSCVISSYNVFYSHTIQSSNNIWCSSNLINCSECIRCNGLENKSYCVDNKSYSKEEYFTIKQSFLNDKKNLTDYRTWELIEWNQWSTNCMWHGIINSNDLDNAYYVNQTHHWRNIILFWSSEDNEYVYDVTNAWSPYWNHLYGWFSLGGEHIYNSCHVAVPCTNIFYSYYLDNCSFCLGCIWLKNKSYCILNKQYTKEERYEKVDEIFKDMDKDEGQGSQLGKFFPASMNPFYFNDTAAYLIDPSFTKEEVTAKWYLWRDEPIKVDIPADAQVVKSSELASYEWWLSPDGTLTPALSQSLSLGEGATRHINAEILKCVIQDEAWNYYRIIPMEYKFLMKHGLPLPRKHWLERMKENFRIN